MCNLVKITMKEQQILYGPPLERGVGISGDELLNHYKFGILYLILVDLYILFVIAHLDLIFS